MKKLSIKPIIYTILILIAIITFTCGESKSKYFKEDESAIKYSVYMKKMSGTPLNALPHGKLSSSTYEEMKFFYTFNRSGNMLNTDTSETYELLPKETCSITGITADNATIYGNLVTFNNIGNETVTVYLNCNVAASTIGEYVNVTLDVNNYFNNSLPKYSYTNGINNISVTDYFNQHPKPEITDFYSADYKTYTMKSTREDKLEGIKTWLNLFANEYPVITYANIYNYIDFLKTIDELTDSDITVLDNYEGLSASINQDGDYVFEVDENFISIVKSHSEKYSNNLYFYDEVTNIDELFLKYLNLFGIYTEEQITTIRDYMTANETDGETILDLANRLRLGMSYNSETKLLDGVEYLYNHIAYNVPVYQADKTKGNIRKLASLKTSLTYVTILTDTDLLTQITSTSNNDRLLSLLAITDTSTMFEGYVYYESSTEGINAIVHVYSNDTTSTFVEITIVDDNALVYNYSNVDVNSIKSDLDHISTRFYSSSLTLLDTEPAVVSAFETLENGTYNLNIGTIVVSGNKTVTITLGDRNAIQNVSSEEEIEINNQETVSNEETENSEVNNEVEN